MTKVSTISTAKALSMYIAASLFLFFEMALQVSPSVMSFQLMHDLSMGTFALGIMSGCYFYTYTLMQIPSGRLLDKFNPRLIITVAIIVCCLGALLLSIAQGLIVACAARLLMGFGSAFAFVAVLTVTADLFKSKYFATLTGVTQMLAALGAMSGQLPISLVVNHLGWRESMQLFAVMGVLLAILIYGYLRYERTPINTCLPEHKASLHNPIRKIVANPQTWYIALYACLLWAPMSGFTSLWGVPFLVKVYGLSHSSAAFTCSLMWVGLAVASPLLGYVSTRFSNRKLPLSLSALFGGLGFGCVLIFHLSGAWLALGLIIAGAACAGQALSFTLVKENNPKHVTATAIAFNNVAVVISGAIFQPLIGWLLKVLDFSSAADFRIALSVIFIAYFIAFIVSVFFINETMRDWRARDIGTKNAAPQVIGDHCA